MNLEELGCKHSKKKVKQKMTSSSLPISESKATQFSLMIFESAVTKFSLMISKSTRAVCADESMHQLWK